MSEEPKKSTVNRPWTEPGVEVRITHLVPTGSPIDDRRKGQPKLTDNSRRISWLIGQQEIAHEEACKLYIDAQEREASAKTVREFWGTVLQNWVDLTEPL